MEAGCVPGLGAAEDTRLQALWFTREPNYREVDSWEVKHQENPGQAGTMADSGEGTLFFPRGGHLCDSRIIPLFWTSLYLTLQSLN